MFYAGPTLGAFVLASTITVIILLGAFESDEPYHKRNYIDQYHLLHLYETFLVSHQLGSIPGRIKLKATKIGIHCFVFGVYQPKGECGRLKRESVKAFRCVINKVGRWKFASKTAKVPSLSSSFTKKNTGFQTRFRSPVLKLVSFYNGSTTSFMKLCTKTSSQCELAVCSLADILFPV